MKIPKLFLRRKTPKKTPAKIFTARSVHKPKEKFLRFFEVMVILLVFLGTLFALYSSQRTRITGFLNQIPKFLTPKQASQSVAPKVAFDESLKIALRRDSIAFQAVSLTAQGDYLVDVSGGLKIFFSSKKDSNDQVSTLQTLLAKAKIEGKQIKKVDFRFENIVVEY